MFGDIYDSLKQTLSEIPNVTWRGEVSDEVFGTKPNEIAIEMGTSDFTPGGDYGGMSTRQLADRPIHGDASINVFVLFASETRAGLFPLADTILAALREWKDAYARTRGIYVVVGEASETESGGEKMRHLIKQFVVSLSYDSDQFFTPINRAPA